VTCLGSTHKVVAYLLAVQSVKGRHIRKQSLTSSSPFPTPPLSPHTQVVCLPAVQPVKGAGTSESILWRDAERTFKTEPFREQMIKV
jgi:hypothetical protein